MKLRYYATFSVRKFESLFCKINTSLQKTTTCIGLQAEQIFSVNILNKFFFFPILGVAFAILFLRFLLHCAAICMSSKSVSQILKILFQTGDIKIFSLVVSF